MRPGLSTRSLIQVTRTGRSTLASMVNAGELNVLLRGNAPYPHTLVPGSVAGSTCWRNWRTPIL